MAETGQYAGIYLGDPDIDFVKLAESQGVKGEKVTSPNEIEAAIKRGIQSTRDGNPYLIARIHPKKAVEKGIKEGDFVLLFNERGSVVCVANITYRVEENTIHAYCSSPIYNPVKPGETSMDIGGCVNVLTPGRLQGSMAPGMVPNSTLMDICKYEGPLPDCQGFEYKLDAIAKADDPDAPTCKEIIEGHGFEKVQAKAREKTNK